MMLDMRCIHCDSRFKKAYLLWHFARRKPSERCQGESVLTCRKCGCMTPVRWQFPESGGVVRSGE